MTYELFCTLINKIPERYLSAAIEAYPEYSARYAADLVDMASEIALPGNMKNETHKRIIQTIQRVDDR